MSMAARDDVRFHEIEGIDETLEVDFLCIGWKLLN